MTSRTLFSHKNTRGKRTPPAHLPFPTIKVIQPFDFPILVHQKTQKYGQGQSSAPGRGQLRQDVRTQDIEETCRFKK